ncbi:unnamed protein product [Penicillium salamii]|uniref:Uncharacterized protein n=1 Tax=Penicillium salamii TaxID=1612424 RepID=A0A9W4IDQ3_9EURO|nr:unnamed protein product [Penicillium salamii]
MVTYGEYERCRPTYLKGHDFQPDRFSNSLLCSGKLPIAPSLQSLAIMDHRPSQASKRPTTPDTEAHNGYQKQSGNESKEYFPRVVGQFVHGNPDHTSQALQHSVDDSAASVATEVATSFATSLASSACCKLAPGSIKAENQDLPPLNAKIRAAESSTVPRKQCGNSYPASQTPGCSQPVHRKKPRSVATISRKLVNNSIQYLQTLSDHILISDTISSSEWATMHLATKLLQSSYEEILEGKEMETHPLFVFDSLPTLPAEKCRKCAAADEQWLHD